MNWSMLYLGKSTAGCPIAFTVAVIVNVVAMVQEKQAVWVGLLALFPLILLLLTGLLHVRAALCRQMARRASASADECERSDDSHEESDKS